MESLIPSQGTLCFCLCSTLCSHSLFFFPSPISVFLSPLEEQCCSLNGSHHLSSSPRAPSGRVSPDVFHFFLPKTDGITPKSIFAALFTHPRVHCHFLPSPFLLQSFLVLLCPSVCLPPCVSFCPFPVHIPLTPYARTCWSWDQSPLSHRSAQAQLLAESTSHTSHQ